MGLERYNQEFECSFNAAVTGSYYGEIINDLEKQGRMVNIERDDVCKTVASWDLGMSDSIRISSPPFLISLNVGTSDSVKYPWVSD